MDGAKIQHALEALVLLLETLRRLECRFAVVRFGGETTQRCLKGMRDDMTLETGQRIIEMCLSPDEGTYPASAVKFCVKPENSPMLGWSASRDNVHQFIIMITDGISTQNKPEDYVCGDKKLCIVQIGDPDVGTQQQAADDLEKIAGKGNTRLVSTDQLSELHEILANLLLHQFARVVSSSSSAHTEGAKDHITPLKVAKSDDLSVGSAVCSEMDVSVLKEQGVSLVECSHASAQVPWQDKIHVQHHAPVDAAAVTNLKHKLREWHAHMKMQDSAGDLQVAAEAWLDWERKLAGPIANLQAAFDATALRVNRYTRMKASTSGSSIDIKGMMK
jgi:hypothetical protein